MFRHLPLFPLALIFLSCGIPKISKGFSESDSGMLVPYMDKETGNYGYVNLKDFRIVIPAMYEGTLPFVGDFAIVENKRNKLLVIDKAASVVLSKFDDIKLFTSEDNSTVYAVTINNIGIKRNPLYRPPSLFERSGTPLTAPASYRFRIYNLSKRSLVIDRFDLADPGELKRLCVMGNYFTPDGKLLYELSQDGSVVYVDNNTGTVLETMTNIMNERSIHYYEINTSVYGKCLLYAKSIYQQDDAGKFAPLIPDGMIFEMAVPLQDIRYNIITNFYGHPFIREDQLYTITYTDGGQDSFKRCQGLYNETKSKWEIRSSADRNDFHANEFEPVIAPGWYAWSTLNGDPPIIFDLNGKKEYRNTFRLYEDHYRRTPYPGQYAVYSRGNVRQWDPGKKSWEEVYPEIRDMIE